MYLYFLASVIMAALVGGGYRIGQLRERDRLAPKRTAIRQAPRKFHACEKEGWDYVLKESRNSRITSDQVPF